LQSLLYRIYKYMDQSQMPVFVSTGYTIDHRQDVDSYSQSWKIEKVYSRHFRKTDKSNTPFS
jgi:hypothetical protein